MSRPEGAQRSAPTADGTLEDGDPQGHARNLQILLSWAIVKTMWKEKRNHARFPVNVDVACEFVPWQEDYLATIGKAASIKALDISETGVCLSFGQELTSSMLKQLLTGTRKLRLGLYLPNYPGPVILFARVVWNFSRDQLKFDQSHCGCAFIEAPLVKIWQIRQYIESLHQTTVAR